jgi:hypothetical protein
MNAPPDTPRCTAEEHEDVLRLVRLGMLFELIEWVESGKPTLCPDFEKPRARQSAICEALDHGNHSMVRFLWDKCWQHEWETDGLVASAVYDRNAAACEIAKYLIRQDLPLDGICAASVFETHDDELILMLLKRGMSVRHPDGFADALSMTGHSKHLLRLYRELNEEYPDLKTEGLLALREAVNDGKLRAAALLTWAGVDPLQRIPDDPYEEIEEPEEGEEDDEDYLRSAFDEVRLSEKTLDMLKALKVTLTDEVWLKFFDEAGWLRSASLDEVYHWVKDPDAILLRHPEKAAKAATTMLRHLEEWHPDWSTPSRQKKKLEVCEYLTCLGVPMLVTEEDYEIRSLRKSLSTVEDGKRVVRLLWVIHEKGDEEQRARLKEVVRTPKMQSLIRQHDQFLLRDLGLGPKRLAKMKVNKRDRPWHPETYKVPEPFEKPPKKTRKRKGQEPEPPARPTYYPPPAPSPPTRPGYWNRYSHFHR